MSNLLFIVQQWLMPIWGMWPVWLSVLVVFLLSTRLLKAHHAGKVILVLSAILLLFFILIRGSLLLVYPYRQQQQVVKKRESEETLPLQVSFQFGDFAVTHLPGKSELLYESYEVANGHTISQGTYQNTDDKRNETKTKAYILRSSSLTSFLTRFWAKGNLTIPSEYSGEEVYNLFESKATLDFRESISEQVHIMVQYTNITLYFPETTGNKEYTLYGGSNFPGVLIIPRSGPRYEILNEHNVIATFPPEFEKQDASTYIYKGEKEGTVSIEIKVANIGGGLAVRMANE